MKYVSSKDWFRFPPERKLMAKVLEVMVLHLILYYETSDVPCERGFSVCLEILNNSNEIFHEYFKGRLDVDELRSVPSRTETLL